MKRRRMHTLIIFVAAVLAVGIAGTFFLSLAAERPSDLGVHDGRLADVPSSPNCVSTYATTKRHSIQPLMFGGDPDQALAKIANIISTMRGTTVVETKSDYLYVEFRSQIFRFVDDVEFFVDVRTNQIRFRSASRTGHSDIGVNRARMERIRKLFETRSRDL
jgi:uncharacterized protein (DUF1499 family)